MTAGRITPELRAAAKPRLWLGRGSAVPRAAAPAAPAPAALPLFSARAVAAMRARCVLRRKVRRKREYVSYNAVFGRAKVGGVSAAQ